MAGYIMHKELWDVNVKYGVDSTILKKVYK